MPETVQTPAPEVRETLMEKVSAVRAPFASSTSTRNVDVETPSAAMGVLEHEEVHVGSSTKLDASCVATPALPLVMSCVHPVTLDDDDVAETMIVPVVVVLVTVIKSCPFVAVSAPLWESVASVGVLFVIVIDGELFATRFPFASSTDTVIFDVPFVPPALATIVVGEALQTSCEAGPYTVIFADAVRLPIEATTLHGWPLEVVAVATKSPFELTAPHPPVTDQITVPVNEVVAVNCCWPLTATFAEVGEIESVPSTAGVVLTWK